MDDRPLPIRRLVAYARAESFADETKGILRRLGYQILAPAEFAEDAAKRDVPLSEPDLYLAESTRLPELPSAASAPIPILLLLPEGETPVDDARVVGSVRSPAGMHDLLCAVQQILEENPRSTPRVRTELPAVCRLGGQEWPGRVVSLSENGCLLRTDETVDLGSKLTLSLELPRDGTVHLRAETAYQIKSELGLVFSSTAPKIRRALSEFVTESLVSLSPDPDPATEATSG